MTSPEQQLPESETSEQDTEFDYLYKVFENFKEQILHKIENKDDRERLHHALTVAIKTHEGQERKISGLPYIVHSLEVFTKVLEVTKNIDILVASLFHDGPEDRPKKFAAAINNEDTTIVTDEDNLPPRDKIANLISAYQSLASKFSPDIADIVLGVTKNVVKETWFKRAKPYIRTVKKEAPDGSSIICAADKICNLANKLHEYGWYVDESDKHDNNSDEESDQDKIKNISANFNNDIHEQLWWFKANAKMLRRKSKQKDFMYKKELETLVDQLDILVNDFESFVKSQDTLEKNKRHYKVSIRAGYLACKSALQIRSRSQYSWVSSIPTKNKDEHLVYPKR